MPTITKASLWTNQLIDIDPYAPAPALDDLKHTLPVVARAALAGGEPPTMFVGGDLPPFLASGLDPEILMSFPWRQRHAVAAEARPDAVYALLNQYSDDPDVELPHAGLDAYLARLKEWAMTSGTDLGGTRAADELIDSLFSARDRARDEARL